MHAFRSQPQSCKRGTPKHHADSILRPNYTMKCYTQNNEQEVIVDYFLNEKGYFCDIGAYDGVTYSNVRALAELGWSGICYEPDKVICTKCVENYRTFPNVVVKQAAVGTHNGETDFYPTSDSMIGTTTKAHFVKWGEQNYGEPYRVPVFDINDVLDGFEKIDFLSIDTEGTNKALFAHLSDYHLQRMQMICVEHDGHADEIGKRLHSFGYTLALHNSENIIYGKKKRSTLRLVTRLGNLFSGGSHARRA